METTAPGSWVSFKTVKIVVTLTAALKHYNLLGFRQSGVELSGRCPICEGASPDSFHVNVDENTFQCFSCQAKGNVLDFVAAMEKCSVQDAEQKLAEWFSISAVIQ